MIDIIWVALGLLIISSLIPHNRLRLTIAGSGWMLFSVHWALQWQYYFELGDYTNVVLIVLAAIFCTAIGYICMLWRGNEGGTLPHLSTATNAAAVGGLSYFVFAEIPLMNSWIISTVTNHTIWLASVFGVIVTRLDWNLVAMNGYKVEIILACTAIESIALFTGIIASVSAPLWRQAKAFLISVPVIYFLNLIRNIFVINAYGMNWFGSPDVSFYIAHTIIAKIGSLIALFIIAYGVLKILPEITDMIDGILKMVISIFKHAG